MSIYTKITNANNHPEGTLLQEITKLIVRGGLWNLETDMIASERGAGQNMSIDVSKGDVFLKRDSFCRPVWSDAVENVVISANGEANPRITTIIAYVDLVATAGASGQGADVAHIIGVDGSASASPIAPNTATIEASIGASDPYEIICDVYVINGAIAIADGDITDRRRKSVARLPQSIESITYSASITPDMANGTQFDVTLTGNITVNAISNMENGDWATVSFIQDGTGGYVPTWFSGITWMSADITINTDPNKRSQFAFRKLTSTTYEGYLVGKEY